MHHIQVIRIIHFVEQCAPPLQFETALAHDTLARFAVVQLTIIAQGGSNYLVAHVTSDLFAV